MKWDRCIAALFFLFLGACHCHQGSSWIRSSVQLRGPTSHCDSISCENAPPSDTNFRTRTQFQANRHKIADGRQMAELHENVGLKGSPTFQIGPVNSKLQVGDMQPERSVPAGPDPLHHRSTPPSRVP